MIVVGLTGGIASGKSTVGGLLRARGVPVIDADAVAREVVKPGTDGLAAIVAAFGPGALAADGQLDRAAMRERITRDPVAKHTLEGITHPAIRRAIDHQLASLAAEGHDAAVVEAALMVETGSYRLYPALIVVSADPETQVQRVRARDGVSEAQARAILATQLPLADKVRVATHVIHNDGDLASLAAQTNAVWEQILST